MKITAKQITWEKHGKAVHGFEWSDSNYGFYISEERSEPLETRFYAVWSDLDGEHFSSLEEAQSWCQGQIDGFISKHAVVELDA